MLRSMLKYAFVAVLASVLPICHADETTVVDLPHAAPLELTFQVLDPQHGRIDERVILAALAQEMTGLTRWPVREKQETSDTVVEVGGRTRFDAQQHCLVVEYLAQSRYLNGGYTGSTLSIPVGYGLERGQDAVKITFTFPDSAHLVRHGLPFLTRKLWDLNQILDDYATLAGKIPGIELHLHFQSKGELESRYGPEAVLGNLERIFGKPLRSQVSIGRADVGGSIAREAVYIVSIGRVQREVRVSVLPYHDGSKVSYVAQLPYTLKGDGSETGGEAPRDLNEALLKVVND